MNPTFRASILFCLAIAFTKADTSFLNTDKYAWAANTGWISFRHDRPASPEGVVFGEFFLSGFAYAANIGWINFGDGTPARGNTYLNDANDHGVNHDGAGNLSGFAWAANTGWINFEWANPTNRSGATDPNRPRVDLLTGAFSGYAWSPNTGWINLGSEILTVDSMYCPDSDGDNIADYWELEKFGNLAVANFQTDTDGDGTLDRQEYLADTDPRDPAHFFEILSFNYNAALTEATLLFSSSPSRLYRIEFDDDLGVAPPGVWTGSSLGNFSPDPGFTTRKSINILAGHKNFFRVQVIRPLTR